MIKCPKCGSWQNTVTDSRKNSGIPKNIKASEKDEVIWRRRKCLDCGKKFNTVERIIGGSNNA